MVPSRQVRSGTGWNLRRPAGPASTNSELVERTLTRAGSASGRRPQASRLGGSSESLDTLLVVVSVFLASVQVPPASSASEPTAGGCSPDAPEPERRKNFARSTAGPPAGGPLPHATSISTAQRPQPVTARAWSRWRLSGLGGVRDGPVTSDVTVLV